MEQLLSTFVRSIFVDNMIFAHYLGYVLFRGCLKEREDRFRIRYSSDIRTFLYVAD